MLDIFARPDLSNQIDLGLFVVAIVFSVTAGSANLFDIPFLNRSGGLLSYSKFAKGVKLGMNVPSRLGMFMLYFPACAYGYSKISGNENRADALAHMICAHFAKRCFECIFVHKYSGSMPAASSAFISFFYTLLAFSTSYFVEKIPESAFEEWTLVWGRRLFYLGLAGNFYHHYLLANLRKPGEKGYKVPRGGFFEYVATPHYFFELIGWYGVSLASHHGMVCLFSLAMTIYLVDRAVGQSEWNRKKIRGYPKTRGHIVPFVF